MERTKLYIKKFKDHWICVSEFEDGVIGVDIRPNYYEAKDIYKQLLQINHNEEYEHFVQSSFNPKEIKEAIKYIRKLNGASGKLAKM